MLWIKIKLVQKMLKHHSKRLTFVQERPGTHASYGALHLTCNAQVEISASDNEVAVSKSEQQRGDRRYSSIPNPNHQNVENV